MKNIVEHIVDKEYDKANEIFESKVDNILVKKLNEAKKMVAAKMCEQVPAFMGAAGGNTEKLKRGINEDELDEMDLSKEKPDYASIEDLRGKKPDIKAGQWWATSQWKQMGPKVTQKQADDIKSGNLKSSGAFSNLDSPRQKSTGNRIGGARPGLAGKNSPNNNSVISQKKQLKEETEELDEAARVGIVKARVRGGKIERRKKVSGVEGYKIQDGKLKRMSPAERRRRKLGQKRGKIKRKAKMRQALMKRKRSLRKRASIGL